MLERWISPSVFAGTDAADEYQLGTNLSHEELVKRIQHHRDRFITRHTFERVVMLGLEVVRLPVGYWLFADEEPYVGGADTYVDLAFEWARQYGLKVILDLHAAPGSQNGWDHSGKSGTIEWHHPRNIEATLAFLERLTKRYGNRTELLAVEPLNEPHWEIELKTLVDYYIQASRIIKTNCHDEIQVLLSDSFRATAMSKSLRRAKLKCALDIHLYQLFTPEDRALDLVGHLKKAEKEWARTLRQLAKHHQVVVGEWSAAMSEQYENGGPRRSYQASEYVDYAQAQRKVFETNGAGWVYWTARTEDRGIWSLLDHPELL